MTRRVRDTARCHHDLSHLEHVFTNEFAEGLFPPFITVDGRVGGDHRGAVDWNKRDVVNRRVSGHGAP